MYGKHAIMVKTGLPLDLRTWTWPGLKMNYITLQHKLHMPFRKLKLG